MSEQSARERAKDLHYWQSYFKQADDTLVLILKGYNVEHEHDGCGVICKINEIEGLIESHGADERREGLRMAAKAQCPGCRGVWKGVPDEPVRQPNGNWKHKTEYCKAGPIYDELNKEDEHEEA